MIKLYVERSKSNSGKHMFRSFYVVVDDKCRKLEVTPKDLRSVKPVYVNGEAFEHYVEVPKGYFAVQLRFVRGLRGRVKGEVLVFNSDGTMLCRAVYRKLKVRVLVCSDGVAVDLIRCVCSQLKIPVKRYALISK
ncbi:MAG: hypothetical protein QW267_07020 [Sulfolobales archaeon]